MNFVSWVIDALRNEKTVDLFTDQYTCPTLADNLAQMLLQLRDRHGVYHTAGPERINRYDFGMKIAEIFGLDSQLINPITSQQMKQKARRPSDSSLDTSKAERELGITYTPIRVAIEEAIFSYMR